MLCEYDCGSPAKFKTKGGKNICKPSPNACPANKKKNSVGLKDAYKDGKFEKRIVPEESRKRMAVNKGLTSATSERVKRSRETWKKGLAEGKFQPSFLGREHTTESKQKMSESAKESNNGYVRTKYYKVFCPFENKAVKVQGTWELKYAEYLNEKKIPWIRSRKKNLKYRLYEDDYIHTYFPDFYLLETDEYIEIKGYMWKSKDGKVDDSRKMKKIIECNSEKKIILLMRDELKELRVL